MSTETENGPLNGRPLILAAISDDELWQEIAEPLEQRFRVRRETDGLRAMDVLLLLRPSAVIAETGLPGLSGILLARLIGQNRNLTKLPVALILSREYLIEEFWARDSGALATVPRNNAVDVISLIDSALGHGITTSDRDWDAAEEVIRKQGGPAAGVANELEKELIGASILARLGEIEITGEPTPGESQSTIPGFIRQALSALASVLEFAQAGVTLFETNEFFIVENDVFGDVLDSEAFIRESTKSASLYSETNRDMSELNVMKLPSAHHELPGPQGLASTFFALPLTGRKANYGLLSLMTYKEIAVREYYLHTLSLIGAQLSVTLERALFHEEVRRLSVTDPLTELSNRRSIIGRLEEEFRRSIRYGSPLSMAVCDLDDFKQVNDQYGHQVGDIVLKEIASILKHSVREVDLAGRWGGEEIALLFPQTDLDGAMVACERIREDVAGHMIKYKDEEIRIELSIGVATIDPDGFCPRSAEVLMGLADHAMYLAKERGKNQVVNIFELPNIPDPH